MLALIAGLTLAALVVAAAVSDRRSVSGAVTVGLLGVLWLTINRPMEGVVLLAPTSTNGLTAADLAGLAAIVVAGRRLWTIRRDRRRPDRT